MKSRNRGEFHEAPIGDTRLQRRLEKIGEVLQGDPGSTFPDAMGSSGELEALYRFLNNSRIDPAAIMEPHIRATTRRMAKRSVAIVHDTSDFVFDGPPGQSLGYIPTTTQRGFLGHFALAVGDGGDALGILGLETLFFENRIRGEIRQNRSKAAMMYAKRRDKASLRWDRMVERTRALIPDDTSAIHVMDCEADNYRLFMNMASAEDRFVVRVRHDRRAARAHDDADWEQIADVAQAATFVCEREVRLSKRRPRPRLNATYKPRSTRTATLRLAASPVTIKKPRKWYPGALPTMSLNLVRVSEVDTPAGCEAVEWLLLTTEPVATRVDVEAVVDWYRRRWVVEEFFKALKTGCGYERRQLESRAALLRTLALLVPIAWQLLALRDAARMRPKASARSTLRDTQLTVLRALTNNKLPRSPTLEQAMLAVAGQGGHLRHNGSPGWQTLGRGLEKILWAEVGYLIALERGKK